MIGIGGFGKCRILKQAVEAFEIANKSIVVRHLSRNAEVTKKSLEDIGDNAGSRSPAAVNSDA
ncbi:MULTISPECIES: hypothetical protein [unclassified Bradyrhizobium]|uniref:hypothetical protein n=1 Tax=unclassified Bradyrhizobium TaxID=2631580 RepID=UPI001CD4A37A|nr:MULTISPECIES: hypothetical protein [unclassified Bradyrhizobium]MCA1385666.1 hypothetical protein [Bradyrhizobium sp. BRP05]MCA1394391.1 hypothetical protein [Bradyrhizobium sp. IC3123]MCA1423923.1 hypothetical protein [Bradyrhizobium sp. BRP23]MCA1430941.1 hypothetical protein [Bradyrhizobium sp. NBAIM16]MCA1438247.1 hypothetical protein [Bradyrhizobium sp. BRP20]